MTAPSCPSCLLPLQHHRVCDTDSLAQAAAVKPLEISHRFRVSFIYGAQAAAVEQLLRGSLTTRGCWASAGGQVPGGARAPTLDLHQPQHGPWSSSELWFLSGPWLWGLSAWSLLPPGSTSLVPSSSHPPGRSLEGVLRPCKCGRSLCTL